MISYFSVILLVAISIALPIYLLIGHFLQGRKSPKIVLVLSALCSFNVIAAILLIALFSEGRDLAAMAAMALFILAAFFVVLIVLIMLFKKMKGRARAGYDDLPD
ncbi:phosphoglycerol transferase MdoB-like AlkP superfamily enzyme [Dysgonomonas sp. PFB1-18]|uniref:hypothetical protein n=1 Tax=unclassified Dysgonomonas TaxID=2630389 RepID=UPI0024745BA2|nr:MULTISPECIES: hypothetical protein [unclassified Dysgonomonas]MDH6310800.1 phosphoglycerol transferase MdoB-like AlkP superfamily enzyme [Dysgonomonas sp. PF1-14]MDH6340650.1 phosphoglycerol transferase MdoB-like AlkP superfamily enzyme [Dysgonomonas sp. PF1-16]MDH6382243.1 phosphoglycerol transferase MdoB-like AlkP superfamily enzyme [Dysgonomonas sp. PFB1-18]MDH6399620.1 phosphoglycerol transferase MdoB-like AlkP superfamily enzyme [Dysgonomonas sp. PF1-23]